MLTVTNAVLFARASLALIFIWFGAMNFTAVGEANMTSWLGGHAFLSGLVDQASSAARATGIYQLVMAALIGAPLPSGSFRRIGFIMLGVYCVIALTVMFTNPVWIPPAEGRAGGFPLIGSGQGIIKYVSILGLAVWAASLDSSRMFSQRYGQTRELALPVMWFGLVLVLAWIGGMKFTLVEAQGIDPLIRSHFALSWMTGLLGLQGVSFVIGIIELITVAALLGFWFNSRFLLIGLAMSAITFVLTLTFLISFGNSWSAELGGFPALSRTGHFLLKDLGMLATCFALAAEVSERGRRW